MLLHQSTQQAIDSFLSKPSHALIIEGRIGAGKKTLAQYLATSLLELSSEKLDNYAYYLLIEPKNNTISINDIREAQKYLKLKTIGQNSIKRVLIVDQAELMTVEAQNAFLKILEEPPTDTVVLILTSQKIKLLPTIRSRAQSLAVNAVTKNRIDDYFALQGYDPVEITAAYHATSGQIGSITSMLNKEEENQQLTDLKQAKSILAMSKFERLKHVDELSKQKEAIPNLVRALSIISQAALKQTIDKDNINQAKRWHDTLKISIEAERKLSANPNSKLLLTDLMLNL